MRRGLGAAGVLKQRERSQKMNELGEKIEASRVDKAKERLSDFKTKLTEFALKYRSRIQDDPVFREQFVSMCDMVGVDPIQISKGSKTWLGGIIGIGDFYSELAVQVLTQCMIQRKSTYGSLLPVLKCFELIQTENVSLDDLKRAIKSLDCFGAGGVRIVTIAQDLFISSLPDEMSKDSSTILECYNTNAGKSLSELVDELQWPKQRIMHAVNNLMREGVLWVDEHEGITTYWVISLWLGDAD
jgi:ESCRT-II complex subunit VPS22